MGTVWHHAPFIEDAVTGKPAEGYGVHIYPGRIIFEPIIGPLLFFMRAHRPHHTYLLLIAWILVIGFLINLRRQLRKKNATFGIALKRCVRSSIVWIPVILVMFLALALLMLFVPLPCNTIKNDHVDTILVNFHSHSYYSYDGMVSPLRLLKWHERNQFDAFFLSEHNHHHKTLALAEQQMEGHLPQKPLILVGQEFSGTHHILLLGLQRDFVTKGLSDEAAIDSTKAQGGVAIVAHWFQIKRRTRPIIEYIKAGVAGFESANYARGIYYKAKHIEAIKKACREHHLLMVGGADYHGYGAANFVWNALRIPNWHQMSRQQQIEVIMEILRHRDQDRIQVLLYRDRQRISKPLQPLAPLITLIDYFRSLNLWQILSWLLWSMIFLRFYRWCVAGSWRRWISHPPGAIATVIGAGCAALTISFGVWILSQYPLIAETNKIYRQTGLWLSGLGIFFFFYCLMLLQKIKKIHIFN